MRNSQPISMGICPTPTKVRYATRRTVKQEADRRGQLAGIELYYYECICGFYHLTKSKSRDPIAAVPTVIGVPHALGLSEAEFIMLVKFDLAGKLTEDESAILRHPTVVSRWRMALGVIRTEAESNLRRISAQAQTADTSGRREGCLRRITLIERRQLEAKTIRPEAPADGKSEVERLSERKRSRRTAGDRAVEVLVNRHHVEFAEIFHHEAKLAGVQLKFDLAETLTKYDLEALRELHPADGVHKPRYPDVHVVLTGDEDFHDAVTLVVSAVYRHLRETDDDRSATHAIIDIVGALRKTSVRNLADALYVMDEWVTVHLPFALPDAADDVEDEDV